MNLQSAHLYFGSSSCEVVATEGVPLPKSFNFDNPEACARTVFEVMSRASGGHTLKGCQLSFHRESGIASLYCKGTRVLYGQPPLNLSAEQAIKIFRETETFALGDVTADRSGAVWTPQDQAVFSA
jgi:hypothetical protein